MEQKALSIVREYALEHLDKTDTAPEFEVYTVWKCKILQNWKFVISTSLPDGMYYEVTYNGNKDEWYLDAYKKFENRRITNKVTTQEIMASFEHPKEGMLYAVRDVLKDKDLDIKDAID